MANLQTDPDAVKAALGSLRHEIEARMGRECGIPIEQCYACQRKLRYMKAALAIVDSFEQAYFEGFQRAVTANEAIKALEEMKPRLLAPSARRRRP